MKTLTNEELRDILDQHALWLQDNTKGKRANLSGADLSRAILSGANLHEANLRGANLSETNLSEANLNGADLHNAYFNDADLSGANLINSNWKDAVNINVQNAILRVDPMKIWMEINK